MFDADISVLSILYIDCVLRPRPSSGKSYILPIQMLFLLGEVCMIFLFLIFFLQVTEEREDLRVRRGSEETEERKQVRAEKELSVLKWKLLLHSKTVFLFLHPFQQIDIFAFAFQNA